MRACVFCGERPESKTNEHVIPQWLIELTGDPKRLVNFGYDFTSEKMREFAFDNFVFPACDECNGGFSDIENDSKEVIVKLLQEKPLGKSELKLLLTWFDKIRLGLWLGFLKLNKNKFGVEPKYYITEGINRADRLLYIYKTEGMKDGINFFAVGTPSFDFAPVAFGFRINQYFFINASAYFLFSHRLGLPFSYKQYLLDGFEATAFIYAKGIERIMTPLVRRFHNINGTFIYQPIAIKGILEDEVNKVYYETDYCRRFINTEHDLQGDLVIESSKGVVGYPEKASGVWIPGITHDKSTVINHVSKGAIWFQNHFDNERVSIDYLTGKYKKCAKKTQLVRKIVNNRLLRQTIAFKP